MPHSNELNSEVKVVITVDPNAELYREMVYKIRACEPKESDSPSQRAKNKFEVNDAFTKISNGLETKIKRIASKYKIPGFSFDDIYQECLFALRFKAIKDYDETKGSTVGLPAMFDRFALLCIRRHLATTLKVANQNRKKILNDSKSLDQDRGNGNEELSLINIIKSNNSPILASMEIKEFITTFIVTLLERLSKFEKKVFVLYVKKYTYEEIANLVLGDKDEKPVKAIDNGLSRIKNKSWAIYESMVEQDHVPYVAMKWYVEAKEREKIKRSKNKSI